MCYLRGPSEALPRLPRLQGEAVSSKMLYDWSPGHQKLELHYHFPVPETFQALSLQCTTALAVFSA